MIKERKKDGEREKNRKKTEGGKELIDLLISEDGEKTQMMKNRKTDERK